MKIGICDVGPRDGLQNDPTELAPEIRAELCRKLAAAGVPAIEAVSFVNDARVPRMAGAERVWELLPHDGPTVFSALVLNERGYDRALAAGVKEVHCAIAQTDAFGKRNQNQTVEDGVAFVARLIERGKADGITVSVGISVAFGCPFDGPVAPAKTIALVERLAELKPAEIGLADTIGVAAPAQVREVTRAAVATGLPIGGHFHNTRNTGYANAMAAVEAGATSLDASVAGVGGCPFAPKATGNIATEDLVYMLHHSGYETGIELGALIEVARWLEEQLRHPVAGLLMKAGDYAMA